MEAMYACLDEGLRVEILKRVGVKSICRFRCVCKSWNSLLSSSFFITAQLSSTNFNSNESTYLLFSPDSHHYGASNCYAFYKKDEFPARTFHPIPFPSNQYFKHYFGVMDVIHGIVCLRHNVMTSTTAILWNPTMRKYLNIPNNYTSNSNYNDGWVSTIIGFGFDGGNNIFKVVRIWTPKSIWDSDRVIFPRLFEFTPKFEVLSSQELRWRSVVVADVPTISLGRPAYWRGGVFINGVIHWAVEKRNNINNTMVTVLVLFDCGLEELKTMELPHEFNQISDTFGIGRMFVYRGMLSLLVLKYSTRAVWVMEEYGVASSWTKLRCDDENFVSIFETFVTPQPVFKGSHHPLNGRVFEPSFLLMDAESQAMSYTINRNHQDGKIYHVVDGTQYDYIIQA